MFELIRSNTQIDFIKYRNMAVLGSLIVIGIGLAALVMRGGFNLGIDFAGGVLVHVRFAQATSINEVRQALETVGLGQDAIQDLGGESKEYLVRVTMESEEVEALSKKVTSALQQKFGADSFEVRRVESVGPRVGESLRRTAILAVLAATVVMGIYITLRFEWRFGVGAAVALFHDVLVAVAGLVLWNYELDLTIIAALLTVVGFSVNDTVVIADRVRENLSKDRRSSLISIMNRSINECLGRTILTSSTALFTVFALYVLGGPVIHGFAFTLLIGFVAGVYSTVYIATPVVLLFEANPSAPRRG